jgi:hypothetical protein
MARREKGASSEKQDREHARRIARREKGASSGGRREQKTTEG